MDVDNGAHETETGASSESLLIHYWYVLRRRRGVVVAFTAFLMLSVGIATSLSTPYYAATAVIEISPRIDCCVSCSPRRLLAMTNCSRCTSWYRKMLSGTPSPPMPLIFSR